MLLRMRGRVLGLWVFLGGALMGCVGHDEAATLLLDVRTDLLPGVEFDALTGSIVDRGGSGERVMASGGSWSVGDRVGSWTFPQPTVVEVDARALRRESIVVQRRAVVDVRGVVGLTLTLSRTCLGMTCPQDTDVPSATMCVGGRCVDPRCLEGDGAGCPEPECRSHDQCPRSLDACVAIRCEAGVCASFADDAQCAPGERCVLDVGCITLDGGIDADGG